MKASHRFVVIFLAFFFGIAFNADITEYFFGKTMPLPWKYLLALAGAGLYFLSTSKRKGYEGG